MACHITHKRERERERERESGGPELKLRNLIRKQRIVVKGCS